MKNKINILLALILISITSCKKDEASVISNEITDAINFTFSVNEKESFEKELALKIKANTDETLKFYKTENTTIDRYDKIIYSNENGNDFIIESNTTSDTLYIYQRDANENKVKEALRYIKVSEFTDKLEFVTLNNDGSVTTFNQYTLNKVNQNSPINRVSNIVKKSNTDIDDLENEIQETGEFLADPTNTHPVTAFYKGIITGLFSDDEDEVFEGDSKSTLNSILDGLDAKRKNIIENLGNIKDFINESKNSLKELTQEQINKLLEIIKEDELTDDEEIDDAIRRDCKEVIDGVAVVDMCGDCVPSILDTCEKDCNDVWGGNAFLDNCKECVFGNTGKVECEKDCNGVYGGTAYLDDCKECVGGNTGNTECVIGENHLIGNWTAVSFNGGNPMGEIQKTGYIAKCKVYSEQWTINSASANITENNISVNISQKTGASSYESSGGEVDCESFKIELENSNFTINDTYTVKSNGTNADLDTEVDCEGEGNDTSTLTISGNNLIFKYCEVTLIFKK